MLLTNDELCGQEINTYSKEYLFSSSYSELNLEIL